MLLLTLHSLQACLKIMSSASPSIVVNLTFQPGLGHRPRVNEAVTANLKTGGFLHNKAIQCTVTAKSSSLRFAESRLRRKKLRSIHSKTPCTTRCLDPPLSTADADQCPGFQRSAPAKPRNKSPPEFIGFSLLDELDLSACVPLLSPRIYLATLGVW